MRMSYLQTWQLVNEMNKSLGPVIVAAKGGSGGGGARLTKVGKALVAEYRAIEIATAAASRTASSGP